MLRAGDRISFENSLVSIKPHRISSERNTPGNLYADGLFALANIVFSFEICWRKCKATFIREISSDIFRKPERRKVGGTFAISTTLQERCWRNLTPSLLNFSPNNRPSWRGEHALCGNFPAAVRIISWMATLLRLFNFHNSFTGCWKTKSRKLSSRNSAQRFVPRPTKLRDVWGQP